MSGVSAFLWQAALMLLAAYFLGAWLGCLLRRLVSRPPKVAMEADGVTSGQTIAAAAAVAAGAAASARAGRVQGQDDASDRFGRALDGAIASSGNAPPPPKPAVPIAELLQRTSKTEGASGDDASEHDTRAAVPDPAPREAAPPPVEKGLSSLARTLAAPPAAPRTPGPMPEMPALTRKQEPETRIEPPAVDQRAPPVEPRAPGAMPEMPTLSQKQEPDGRAETPANGPPVAPSTARADTAADDTAADDTATTRRGDAVDLIAADPMVVGAPPAEDAAAELSRPMSAATAFEAGRVARLARSDLDLPAATGSGEQAVVSVRIERAEPAADVASVPAVPVLPSEPTEADRLTLIEGLTDADARLLDDAGVRTFAGIAEWTSSDVQRIAALIGDKHRISRENWIEQAQLLRNGGATAFARHSGARPVVPKPATVERLEPLQSEPPQSEPSQSEPSQPEPAEHEAARTAPPSAAVLAAAAASAAAAAAALSGRQEGRDAGPAAQVATAVPSLASTPVQRDDPAGPVRRPQVAERAAFATRPPAYRDDLQRIDGINGEVEKLLFEQGVTRISQIADWSSDEERRIDRLLGGMNRVHREGWVRQAGRLLGRADETDSKAASIEQTPASIAPAEGKPEGSKDQPNVDDGPDDGAQSAAPDDTVVVLPRQPRQATRSVHGLRSVRSEALIGGAADDGARVVNDLKRIRGIGVLVEKRLQSMGVSSYEQIAAWNQADVDRVSQQLDFRGRVERENWVEQARILATGGQTDFSRRQDRRDS